MTQNDMIYYDGTSFVAVPDRIEIDGQRVKSDILIGDLDALVGDSAAYNAKLAEYATYGLLRRWMEAGDTYGLGYTEWAVGSHPDDGIDAALRYRRGTDADRLTARRQQRIADLRGEVEEYIDTSIIPATRSMLHDGVLSAITAEIVRAFIADCYDEANSVFDALEAAADLTEIEQPTPVWPAYGG